MRIKQKSYFGNSTKQEISQCQKVTKARDWLQNAANPITRTISNRTRRRLRRHRESR